MSEQVVVDNLDFARRGAGLQGEIAVAELGRLRDFLLSSQGRLNYSLSGKTGAKGEPLLECKVEGLLVLQCQRCLEPLEYPLHIASVLKVEQGATQFDGAEDEEEEIDSIPASTEMSVPELIEEEILLDLPIAPLHEPEVCGGRVVAKPADEGKTSPFAALASLKGKL